MGDYYLRQRYYDIETGRFNRRDSYEGKPKQPLSPHKYLYAHANPANLVDPNGLTPIDDGNWIHDEITEDFLSGGTLRKDNIAVWQIWDYEGVNSSSIPISVVWTNRRQASLDLVEFHSTGLFGLEDIAEVYEIGTTKALPRKSLKMSDQYIPDINNGLEYAGHEPRYTFGTTYRVLPPIRRDFLTGQTALILPPIGGVISYVILSNGTSSFQVEDAFFWTTMAALTAAAAALSARTLGRA